MIAVMCAMPSQDIPISECRLGSSFSTTLVAYTSWPDLRTIANSQAGKRPKRQTMRKRTPFLPHQNHFNRERPTYLR